MIVYIKSAFKNLIKTEAKWLDEPTRIRALEKLDALTSYLAYPEWIYNDEQLDEEVGFNETNLVKVVKGKYFQSVLELKKFEMIKVWRELKKPRNLTKEWMMSPIHVNAAYGATHNAIFLPAAILHPPFFDPGRPLYVNAGAIGSVIGHEITHGFDDQGREYDQTGALADWWTLETAEKFKNASQCFVEQYGMIQDQVTGKKLNGINTLGENIADNGGIRSAFNAFQEMAKNHLNLKTIPELDHFTFEQIFFLSYANIWCASSRLEMLRSTIDYGFHSPERYRVNVPLANFDSFARAFNCTVGSRMNPRKRCRLW